MPGKETRRATEQIDAGSQPSVRVRRRVSRRTFETVPSLRTRIFSRFRQGRRRAPGHMRARVVFSKAFQVSGRFHRLLMKRIFHLLKIRVFIFGTRNASDEVTFSPTFYPNFFRPSKGFIRLLIGRRPRDPSRMIRYSRRRRGKRA